VIRGLQAEVAAMRQGLAAVLGAGAAAPTAVRPPGAPPGATPGVRPPAAWTLATPTGKQVCTFIARSMPTHPMLQPLPASHAAPRACDGLPAGQRPPAADPSRL
jgi:hypothetical protein